MIQIALGKVTLVYILFGCNQQRMYDTLDITLSSLGYSPFTGLLHDDTDSEDVNILTMLHVVAGHFQYALSLEGLCVVRSAGVPVRGVLRVEVVSCTKFNEDHGGHVWLLGYQ